MDKEKEHEMEKKDRALSLKNLTKSNVWDIQENDIFRMWENAEKDADLRENLRRYVDIVRSAFMIEELADDSAIVKTKYEKQGYQVAPIKIDDDRKVIWALKKKPIVRVTDLTYENIHHISAAKLLEVIDRNFGGGWDSLSQSIKDIIEAGFDISTTTLPKDRLHKKGGMYEKKVEDGFEVLEVAKGLWVEAIFAKAKPEPEKPRMKSLSKKANEEEEDYEIEDPDDDEITEENYSTMMDLGSEDPDEEAANMAEYGEE